MDSSSVDFGLVQDVHGLSKIRQMAGKNADLQSKKQALYTAAEQFESLLNQFWVKAMRESNDSICPDSPLKSKESDMFQSMLDEQMITSLAKTNAGNKSSITTLIVKQFARAMGDDGKAIIAEIEGNKGASNQANTSNNLPERTVFTGRTLDDLVLNNTQSFSNRSNNMSAKVLSYAVNKVTEAKDCCFDSPKDFVDKMMPIAKSIASKFGLNPIVIVGQAALETGWGKHIMSGNNMFGIKAGSSWDGNTNAVASDEYINGNKTSLVSLFRSYDSIESSVKDYISLILGNERYSKAVEVNSDPDQYFEEIQKAGYATDPNYASKLKSIIRSDAFSPYL